MHSRSRLLIMVMLLVVGTLALPWVVSAQEPVTSRLKLSIGGYIKPEFMYRTNNGGNALSGTIPGIQNFGVGAVPQHGTIAGENGQFVATAAETRFNFTLTAPDWRGLKPTAFLEMDFMGDTASTIERFSACCAAGFGNAQGNVANGGFRIRHAFLRLAGEGLGGSYELTFGQTWGIFGMLPYYAGSTLDFGGATIWGQRQPQLSLRHTMRFFRDFAWETAIGAMADTNGTNGNNETPAGDISGRLIYSGWQGWQGGGRAPTSLGVSGRLQRQKADVLATAGGFTGTPFTRSLSATAWGFTGGIFLPILPGVSATDRTWALSVVGEGGLGEGIFTLSSIAVPLPGAVALGFAQRADTNSDYFKPSSCTAIAGSAIGAASLAPAGLCPAGQAPTELSLVRANWASYNVQFYLPWNFWLSGGSKWGWFPNVDNASAQTCNNNTGAGCAAAAGLTHSVAAGSVNQGNFNPVTGTIV